MDEKKHENPETKENTVLIVDDSPICLRHAAGILKGEYRVACAKSGEMALSYLKDQRPSLILLDVNMPEMNGFAVYRRIMSDEERKTIPVLFLTGVEDASKAEELRFIPAENILHKPVQPKVLLERIRELL